MSIIHLPSGIGDTTGYSLATTSPFEVNGNVWYVHFGTGTDAVSPAGQNRNAPLKTLAQASTNAGAGDIIVLMDGHVETLTAKVTINEDITVIGAGTSGGYPTAKITNNQAAAAGIELSGGNMHQLRNIWFTTNSQACSAATVRIDDAGATGTFIIDGCYFECDANDNTFALEIDTCSVAIIKNTTFISTATSLANQPYAAIGVDTTALTITAVMMIGVVIDGGTYGWSNYHAVELSQNASNLPTMVNIEGMSLLRGSDMRIDSSTYGWVNVPTQSGGCRIDWDGVV